MNVARSAAVLFLVMTASSCSSDRPEVGCMRHALGQEELHDGQVVFGDRRGVINRAHASWSAFGRDAVLPMASLTKPLIAEEIRLRVERGQFSLDTSLAALVKDHRVDAETGAVTLRQLIQHQAGFDRAASDPLFAGGEPDCEFAAGVVLGRNPEFPPGERIIYSNAGYCVLGELLKFDSTPLPPHVDAAVRSPLGAAGGWRSSLSDAYAVFQQMLPLHSMPTEISLPDGSYYAYAWRHWSKPRYPEWSHFGRLPGALAIAATDGSDRLLVAYFKGDPKDVDATAESVMKKMWACMPVRNAEHHQRI